MRQYIELTEREYDVGLVTFQTEERAMDFAHDLSTEWRYEDEWYVVVYCRWAAAMADGSTVIAAVRTPDGELEQWVAEMAEKYADYGVQPMGSAVAQYFKDGQRAAAGHEGGP